MASLNSYHPILLISIMFILHLLLCPVSCFNQAQSAIPPRGLLFEEKNRLGSAPPTCHNKCNQCHPCMAVQVPNHEHVQPGHAAMKGSFFLQGSNNNRYSNYKPLSWKCHCGGHFFNP
ncbi:EPIDERMAL PATTERNING FACTOR protein [Trifolium repens]|nr:EPIDERMAL PATTERNING FACTOR protein [Trifolium repens]